MATVFLSSTFIEMEDYRRAAAEAIDQYGHHALRMETFPAASREIVDFCRDRVKECDVFVLLLGRLYGTPIANRDISYTEDEFDAARALEKPILVFEASPTNANIAAALDAVETNGLVYETQRARQKALIKKAHQGRLARIVKDVPDMKFQVGHSLAEHFRASTPTNAGERLPQLCNRTRQVEDFGSSFQASVPGRPEVYVVHGHEQEQHRVCVQRLICRHITYPKRGSSTALIGPPDNRSVVEWPLENDPQQILFNRLRRRICLSIDPGYTFPHGDGAPAFCELALASNLPYLRFRHVLRREGWTAAAQALCVDRYLPFWREVASIFARHGDRVPPPRVLVFFEFKHALADPAEAAAFGQALAATFQSRPEDSGLICCVLPELSRVRQEDLDLWYDQYNAWLLAHYRTQPISTLFPAPPLHMIDVENRLRQLVGLEGYGG